MHADAIAAMRPQVEAVKNRELDKHAWWIASQLERYRERWRAARFASRVSSMLKGAVR